MSDISLYAQRQELEQERYEINNGVKPTDAVGIIAFQVSLLRLEAQIYDFSAAIADVEAKQVQKVSETARSDAATARREADRLEIMVSSIV